MPAAAQTTAAPPSVSDEVDAAEIDGPRPTVVGSMSEIVAQRRNAKWDALLREAASRAR